MEEIHRRLSITFQSLYNEENKEEEKTNSELVVEEKKPKPKLFEITKDINRERKELELLENEVEELERDLEERTQLMKQISQLEEQQGGNTSLSTFQLERNSKLSKLERIIVDTNACISMACSFDCSYYLTKLLREMQILYQKLEHRQNLDDVLTRLDMLIAEHSYYFGYQLPVTPELNEKIDCSKFMGYQRMYKYAHIIEEYNENNINVIDISPTNIMEFTKLVTRKIQCDLEILCQIRHFRSITLFKNHDTSCKILHILTDLIRKTKYPLVIINILVECNTISVVNELLRLSLVHYDAFNDYIYFLLNFLLTVLGLNQQIQKEEFDLLEIIFGETTTSFNLILCFNYAFYRWQSESKLNKCSTDLFYQRSKVEPNVNEFNTDSNQLINYQIIRITLQLILLLIKLKLLLRPLNQCNRLERLLPCNLIEALLNTSDIKTQTDIIFLIGITCKNIKYGKKGMEGKQNKLTNIVFSYKEVFMEMNAPQVLIYVLNQHVDNYLTAPMDLNNNTIDKLVSAICFTMKCVLEESITLDNTSSSSSSGSIKGNESRFMDEELIVNSNDTSILRENYASLFYILMKALFARRIPPLNTTSNNRLNNNNNYDCKLFISCWENLYNLFHRSISFRHVVNRQLEKQSGLKDWIPNFELYLRSQKQVLITSTNEFKHLIQEYNYSEGKLLNISDIVKDIYYKKKRHENFAKVVYVSHKCITKYILFYENIFKECEFTTTLSGNPTSNNVNTTPSKLKPQENSNELSPIPLHRSNSGLSTPRKKSNSIISLMKSPSSTALFPNLSPIKKVGNTVEIIESSPRAEDNISSPISKPLTFIDREFRNFDTRLTQRQFFV
ncbi:hypothetical protein ABK040_013891 [Willaertia magna]